MRVTAAALLHCAVHLAFASTALVFANEAADLELLSANVEEPADLPPVFANVKEGLKPLQSAGSTVTPSPTPTPSSPSPTPTPSSPSPTPTPTPTPPPPCECGQCKKFVKQGTKLGKKETKSQQVEVCAAFLGEVSCGFLNEEESLCSLTLDKDYTQGNACSKVGFCPEICPCTCTECQKELKKATSSGDTEDCKNYIRARSKCTLGNSKKICNAVIKKGDSYKAACKKEGLC